MFPLCPAFTHNSNKYFQIKSTLIMFNTRLLLIRYEFFVFD